MLAVNRFIHRTHIIGAYAPRESIERILNLRPA
jgi:hypothetical protein